jgi:hypothetical protein
MSCQAMCDDGCICFSDTENENIHVCSEHIDWFCFEKWIQKYPAINYNKHDTTEKCMIYEYALLHPLMKITKQDVKQLIKKEHARSTSYDISLQYIDVWLLLCKRKDINPKWNKYLCAVFLSHVLEQENNIWSIVEDTYSNYKYYYENPNIGENEFWKQIIFTYIYYTFMQKYIVSTAHHNKLNSGILYQLWEKSNKPYFILGHDIEHLKTKSVKMLIRILKTQFYTRNQNTVIYIISQKISTIPNFKRKVEKHIDDIYDSIYDLYDEQKQTVQNRCLSWKYELLEQAYHPDRVAKWCREGWHGFLDDAEPWGFYNSAKNTTP